MAKSLRKYLLLTVMLICTLCLALTACVKKPVVEPPVEGTTATLRINAGNGGTLTGDDIFEVNVGENLLAFLADKTPEAEAGLTFGGWFNGTTQITNGDTMPESGLTLTAKYLASYTAHVWMQDEAGNYPAEAEVVTGSSWYQESFSYPVPAGFSLDGTGEGSYASTTSLGKDEVFTVWLRRATYRVSFDANLPAGESTDVSFGDFAGSIATKVVFPNGDEYGVSAQYYFAGWARTVSGEVEYLAGEEAEFSELFTGAQGFIVFYARWQTALTDVFGGDDYLFFDMVDETAIHLRRGPLNETGTYDPNTKLFSLGDGVLEGKVIEGGYFYYFRDLAGNTFTFGGEADESLTFTGLDGVSYTHVSRTDFDTEYVTEEGVYTVDPVTGEYVFEGNDGTSFHFSVNFQVDEEGERVLVFNRATSAERGFYAYRDSAGNVDTSRLVLLDGMIDANGIGGAHLYTFDGAFHLAYSAFYYLNDDGFYTVIDSDSYLLFLLKTLSYDGSVGGIKLAGVVQYSDGINGAYSTYDEFLWEMGPSFIPDGFGNATLNGTKGTYVIETYSLWTYSSDGYLYEWEDEWVVFTASSGTRERTYIRFVYFAAAGEVLYTTMGKAPEVVAWSDAAIKPYGSVYTSSSLPSSVHAVFYKYVDDQWYVFAWYSDTFAGVDVYANLDVGLVTDLGNGEYLFESANANYGGLYYYFRYNADGTVTVSLGNDADLRAPSVSDPEGEAVLVVDKWGTLSYGGKTYAYGEWERVFTFAYYEDFVESHILLTFELSDGNAVHVWYFYDWETHIEYQTQGGYDADGNYYEEEVPIEVEYQINYYYVLEDAVFELRYELYPGQTSDFPYLWLLSDDYAAISMFDIDGYDYFYFFGTVTKGEDGTYRFELDEKYSPEGLVRDDVFTAFSSFTFRLDGKYALYYDSYDIFSVVNEDGSSFTMDGYGNAIYKTASGNEIEGVYDIIVYRETEGRIEYLISLTPSSGSVRYFIIDFAGETLSFYEAANASVYNWFNDGFIYYEDYVVFFGNETATEAGTAYSSYDGELGTYVATGHTFTYYFTNYYFSGTTVWTEYVITLPSRTYKIGLTVYNDMYIYMDSYSDEVEFATVDGDRLWTDGYTYAYEIADAGITYYGYFVTVNIYDDTTQGWTYVQDDNGLQIIFVAYYVEMNGQLYSTGGEMYFDFVEGSRTLIVARTMLFGTFAYFKNGAVTDSVMYLDGHGGAILRDENGTVRDSGSYSVLADELTYLFKSETQSFRFTVSTYADRTGAYYIYSNIEDEAVYVSDDWSVLVLGGLRLTDDGYTVDATYINSYGFTYEGLFEFVTNYILKLQLTNGAVIYFNMDGNSFSVNSDTFVVENGVLYAYQGPSEIYELIIPNGVKEIAEGVFEGIQGGRFGAHNFVLDLNEVEIIGAYAFADIVDFMIEGNAIYSDKVTYIGDYAFASMDEDAFSSLNSAYFPNVKYIGAYAFYGNNQFNLYSDKEPEMGRVKLDSIEYIGAYAFCINRWATVDTFLTLDLTDADLSKLVIDPTAFNPGPSSYGDVNEIGYPVLILVSANGAFSFIASLPDYLQSRVEIVGLSSENPYAGRGYYSFSANEYLLFGTQPGELGLPTLTRYIYENSDYTASWAMSTAVYSVDVNGAAAIYVMTESGWTTYGVVASASEISFKLGDNVYYKTGEEHELALNGGADILVLKFTVSAVSTGYVSVDLTIAEVIYNDYAGVQCSYFPPLLQFQYDMEGNIYQVAVDLGEMTSSVSAYRSAFYTLDGKYKAVLGGFTVDTGRPWYLYSLAVRGEDGSYTVVYSVQSTFSNGVCTIEVVSATSNTVYTVKYVAASGDVAAHIEVTAETSGSIVVTSTDANETYVATFKYENIGEATELTRFQVKNAWGSYENVHYPAGWVEANVAHTATNTFTVRQATTQYTIVYHPAADGAAAYITVEVKTLTIVKADTAHDEKAPFYRVSFYVDEAGNVIGLAGEIVLYKYDSYWGYTEDGYIMIPDNTVRDGNTFTFTTIWTEETYVITVSVTESADGFTYAVTVVKS